MTYYHYTRSKKKSIYSCLNNVPVNFNLLYQQYVMWHRENIPFIFSRIAKIFEKNASLIEVLISSKKTFQLWMSS